ncbi:DUF1236 domain-containing protein [Methylovirgula sp. 4M-Z18]|uniref:DUF1236 domain-containing protein n=1 Tax=Methylovirgula sp. 4M-Z18 TaxID=2293567 RepID=UPI001FDFA58A|nr:DUF1236 domain-containing protein [Methylovirgula sp. 4M-Z18]
MQVIGEGDEVAAPPAPAARIVISREVAPRFRTYVESEGLPSYHYDRDLRPGVILPDQGVTYYEVPSEYGVNREYRYAIINDEPVIVDPVTRRVIEVIE